MTKPLYIFGAGPHAREVAWLASELNGGSRYKVMGLVDKGRSNAHHGSAGFPLLTMEDLTGIPHHAEAIVAVGDPRLRRAIASEAVSSLDFRFATLIDTETRIGPQNNIGPGSVVFPNCVVTVNVEIGCHVHINLACCISHDVRIGDYCTLSPGVHVCGNVILEQGVFVGAGATLRDGSASNPLRIGEGAVIAAGACVTTDVEPHSLYAGVPAKRKDGYLSQADLGEPTGC